MPNKDLISRAALLEIIANMPAAGERGIVSSIYRIIQRQPTIDAAPVVHGGPRVMTLEEVNALDWDYCYLEQERLPGNEYREILGKYIMTCVTWPSITAAKILHGMDNYGITWRCWTARPTDEQREAMKWNK